MPCGTGTSACVALAGRRCHKESFFLHSYIDGSHRRERIKEVDCRAAYQRYHADMTYPSEITIRPISRPMDRTICLPGSKSLTNRALLVAALARGTSVLSGILIADDTRLMVDALVMLGVHVEVDVARRRAVVQGVGGFFPNSDAELECGNAGTVIRFLTAACAASVGEFRLDGSPRLRERPIGELVNALRDLGAAVRYDGEDGRCPLAVSGKGLRGGQVTFERPISSQFVSAVLLAAPRAANDVMIRVEGGLLSAPYVRMTLDVMRAFGVEVIDDTMTSFIVPAPQAYQALEYLIEPDASAASYFLAAAALTGGRVTVEGLGQRSAQGDIGFVNVLEQMGCAVEQGDRHTTVRGPADGRLRGVSVDLGDMPDVAQTLAVLAAFAEGPTQIRNVGNLRVKETDRLFAVSRELARLGVETEVTEDSIVIRPTRSPVAAIIETYDDHRMAMSFALAGLRVDGVVIKNPGCVSKTFPEFFEVWGEM